MHPEAFKIFDTTIYWYGILITLGILAAITYSWFRAKYYGMTHDELTDLAFLVIIVGILGARIFYILTHLEFFIANPGQIFQLQMQGMAFLGIIIFNIPAVLIFAKVRKINFWRMVDLAAPGIAIGYFFGRLGCFMGGCCFGPACSWGIVEPGTGISTPIFPTQLLNALVALVIFGALWFIGKKFKLKAGELFVWFVYIYAFTSTITEFFRADQGHEPIWGTPLNPAQWGNIALIIVALLVHFLLIRKSQTPSMVDEETVKMIEEKDKNSGKKLPAKPVDASPAEEKTEPAEEESIKEEGHY
jgi:phosphatidylglycerol---prolipoprotein diacylglyceryl transferase